MEQAGLSDAIAAVNHHRSARQGYMDHAQGRNVDDGDAIESEVAKVDAHRLLSSVPALRTRGPARCGQPSGSRGPVGVYAQPADLRQRIRSSARHPSESLWSSYDALARSDYVLE